MSFKYVINIMENGFSPTSYKYFNYTPGYRKLPMKIIFIYLNTGNL